MFKPYCEACKRWHTEKEGHTMSLTNIYSGPQIDRDGNPCIHLQGIGLFATMELKIGQTVKFKVFGYEIADVRNPNPPPFAEGQVVGDIVLNNAVAGGGYVPLWCKRENREPTTIFVCLENIVDH